MHAFTHPVNQNIFVPRYYVDDAQFMPEFDHIKYLTSHNCKSVIHPSRDLPHARPKGQGAL